MQALWLAGKRDEAAKRVPLELGMNTNLLGPPEAIRQRLRDYEAVGINTVLAKLSGSPTEQLDTLGQLLDLAAET